METKRPFARVAGWAAWWLAVAAVTAAVVTALVKPPPEVSQPSAFELALLTLSALGVFACLLASLLCGAVALWGVRQHGRRGILAPALCGMALAVAMLVPVVWGMFSSFAVQARQVKARKGTIPAVAPSPRQ